MDVIGTERRPVRLAAPPAGLVAVLAVAVLVAGVVAALVIAPQARQAAMAEGTESVKPAVAVSLGGGRASPMGAGVTGELLVVLVSSRDSRVRLGAQSLTAPGLRAEQVSPVFGRPLGPRERREYAVT
ncbi:MAG: hypothetical protein H7323_04200, partial [Frankiales bacterium]|nr:hypothetical protein [Frankiales bacterium]